MKIKFNKTTIIKKLTLLLLFISIRSFGIVQPQTLFDVNTMPLFRVQMRGVPVTNDEVVFYYQQGATVGFDNDYDAYHLFGPNPIPHISIDNDSLLLTINGIPPVVNTYTTLLLVTTPVSGTFTLSTADVQDLPSGTCVTLSDLYTNTSVNLLQTPYVFNLSNTTTVSRFLLTISYNSLPVISNLVQPSCQLSNAGKFSLGGNGFAPWNYTWKDTLGNVIKTSTGLYTNDSLDNLSGGGYIVEIISASNACKRNEISFNINQVVVPVAEFNTSDSISVGVFNNFTTTNSSSNCSDYYWSFGDGSGASSVFEPTYTYSLSGNYSVKLVGISNTGCKDSVIKNVFVADLSTNLNVGNSNEALLSDLGNNTFRLQLSKPVFDNLDISVISLNGQESFYQKSASSQNEELINLNSLNPGLYLLSISSQNKELLTTKIYIK